MFRKFKLIPLIFTATLMPSAPTWAVSPLVFNKDRIANFQTIPEGDREYVGQFMLTVESVVPEPSTMLLSGVVIVLALTGAKITARV